MGMLTTALQEEQWDVAALCLTIGLLQAALQVPKDALPGLLEALEEAGQKSDKGAIGG